VPKPLSARAEAIPANDARAFTHGHQLIRRHIFDFLAPSVRPGNLDGRPGLAAQSEMQPAVFDREV
jgi:hypothetical protein